MRLVHSVVKLEVTDEDLKFFKDGKQVTIPGRVTKHSWVGRAIPVELVDDESRGTLIWVPFVEPDEIRGFK